MKGIFGFTFCVLVSHISAQQHTNATHLARSKRAVQSNLAGYIAICNNNNIGLVICNSDGLFTTTDNNGNTVSNTKCDATGTIDCKIPNDPRPLQFCSGLTPYCVENPPSPATCSANPQVLPTVGGVISTCPTNPTFTCTDVGNFPDSEDCRKFWRCQLSTTTINAFGGYQFRPPTPIICPQGSVFDPTLESGCRYVGLNQASNSTVCINIRTLCGPNSDQRIPLKYPWLLSNNGQYVATCQGSLRPFVTFCPPHYDPNYAAMPASCNLNCRNPYGKIRAYNDPAKYYICMPTDNVGGYMPVLQPCGPFQVFNPTTEQCEFFLGNLLNLG